MSHGPSTFGTMITSSLSPISVTSWVRSSSTQGLSRLLTRVQSWVSPKSTSLPTRTRPSRAASLRSAGIASSRLPSRMSACLAMSGTFAAIFSFEASKKWIIRDGLNGISRGRVGRADRERLEEVAGVAHRAPKDILLVRNRLGSQWREHGRSDRASREDRRAARDHRDGAAVRRRADHPQRRALRPRGRVPRADRRADEGARAVRRDDPRGVRRDGARPDHLRDDRRGALARLDLDLRRRQHPLHRLLPADEVRHRRAEGVLPAEDGDRRDPRRVLAVGARGRLRRAGHQGRPPPRTATTGC